MALNWVPRLKYTQAETDTHRYRITYTAFEGGLLHVWQFDDNAPYGRKLIHDRPHNTVAAAKRTAEYIASVIAEHGPK